MNYRLGTYLILEKIAEDVREEDEAFAELIAANIEPFWAALTEAEQDELTEPETSNKWRAHVRFMTGGIGAAVVTNRQLPPHVARAEFRMMRAADVEATASGPGYYVKVKVEPKYREIGAVELHQ